VAPPEAGSAWKAQEGGGAIESLRIYKSVTGSSQHRSDREGEKGHEALPFVLFVLFVSFVVLPLR